MAILRAVQNIRNFSIIAHIDHGKSTLADCFIRLCGGLAEREMTSQVLDTMDIERERGITIKAQTAALNYRAANGEDYILNLIDTPGHVDFSHEVSRALAACEGALVVVDAAQGVEAQTIATCAAADSLAVAMLPVLNKIDLAAADPARARKEIEEMLGIDAENALLTSAKTGDGAKEILEKIVREIPPPSGDPSANLRARVVDAWFDNYVGVVMLVRMHDGALNRGEKIRLFADGGEFICEKLGVFTPRPSPREKLSAGEVGYIIAGIRDIRQARVGDTVTRASRPAEFALPGFSEIKPRVFASLYPAENRNYEPLREAMEKLHLNDASLSFEPERSPALGTGLRCGFLGLLHMEIVQERLEREYGMELVVTAPGVAYEIALTDGNSAVIDNPGKLPSRDKIREIREPVAAATVVTPSEYLGKLMTLAAESRGDGIRVEHVDGQAMLRFDIPLAELFTGFFSRMKSASRGRASLDYDFQGWRAADIVKLEVLVNGEKVDALAMMVPRADAERRGRETAGRMRELIPRQMFEVAVQAAVGGKIVARETVRALRKNVLAKCYGGDITRKKKLLEKQKAGKKRMKRLGNVDIPQSAFLAMLHGGAPAGGGASASEKAKR